MNNKHKIPLAARRKRRPRRFKRAVTASCLRATRKTPASWSSHVRGRAPKALRARQGAADGAGAQAGPGATPHRERPRRFDRRSTRCHDPKVHRKLMPGNRRRAGVFEAGWKQARGEALGSRRWRGVRKISQLCSTIIFIEESRRDHRPRASGSCPMRWQCWCGERRTCLAPRPGPAREMVDLWRPHAGDNDRREARPELSIRLARIRRKFGDAVHALLRHSKSATRTAAEAGRPTTTRIDNRERRKRPVRRAEGSPTAMRHRK